MSAKLEKLKHDKSMEVARRIMFILIIVGSSVISQVSNFCLVQAYWQRSNERYFRVGFVSHSPCLTGLIAFNPELTQAPLLCCHRPIDESNDAAYLYFIFFINPSWGIGL